MPATRVSCPNCRQPVTVDVQQVFDLNQEPDAKQRLMSGTVNVIQCPNCRYQGNLATPILYHDPEKELFLTYVPPEMGLPLPEQERLLGSLMNQVINKLPQEKRKGYLLRPQPAFTYQGLVERILEADGITKEMLDRQQKRLALLQRLVSASSPDVMAEIAKQEDAMIDQEFFGILSRLVEVSGASGDEQSARALTELQRQLLPITTFGRELQSQTKEIEAAMQDLRALGNELTREKLLDLVIAAPNETRLSALVSMARAGFDYQFFQLLSETIDRAPEGERARLVELREHVLKITSEIDRQMNERMQAASQLLEKVLQAPNVEEALMENLPGVDDFFVQEVNRSLDAARKQGDLERSGKLQQIIAALQSMEEAPPEVAFIEELMQAPDDASRLQLLESHAEEVTPEFLNLLMNFAGQMDEQQP
ncbi:MAG TPA: CpXC domain-containing protein, partial [Anaerolineales bacterium]|nr:CpXC domain-containing protein [Anaerolineales bacterium]